MSAIGDIGHVRAMPAFGGKADMAESIVMSAWSFLAKFSVKSNKEQFRQNMETVTRQQGS
jgi:hypothetical protein